MKFPSLTAIEWGWGTTAASALLLYLILGGCAPQAYRYADTDPVADLGDMRPTPVPEAGDYDLNEYYTRAFIRHPVRKGLSFRRAAPSADVNSMDEVPASSWYTPRLGYGNISPPELLRGPFEYGPPQKPITVVKAKVGGGNPGFIIADARGERYLIKFDPPEFPGIETTTALIVNRLFWGFGYNVPEDYLFYFRAQELNIDPGGELRQEDVNHILDLVAPPAAGQYRSTASHFIKGQVLGAISEWGVRKDDPNDLIDHENRRVMRALRVFCAFTNQSGIRPDNSLDAYVGQAGKGYVRHYLLDFGEAMGGHGAGHGRLWDGHEHMFSFGQLARNLVTFGLVVKPWEHIEFTPWRSVGAFEGKVFSARDWKETFAFLPITCAQPADNYWAAKIVGAITPEQIETLVAAAEYPEPGAARYVAEVLIERRRKILEYFLYQVSPVEALHWSNDRLYLTNMGKLLLEDAEAIDRYEVRFYDDHGEEIAPAATLASSETDFSISVPASMADTADGYLRVDVRVQPGNRPAAPRPVQFHLRRRNDSQIRLVGVVH